MGIMRDLMHKLDGRRQSHGQQSSATHTGYAASPFDMSGSHSSPPIHYNHPYSAHPIFQTPIPPGASTVDEDDDDDAVDDAMPLRALIVPHANMSVRTRRLRRMAPNLLSPFISQPAARHSAIRMDLKEAAAMVFSGDLEPRFVLSHTSLICKK